MNHPDIVQQLTDDLGEHKSIILICRCAIEYWGRSRSVIGSGDRIILLKSDSTLIVHSPGGFKPVNWMSSPTDTSVSSEDGKVLIFSQRTVKPFEEIRITIEEVIDYRAYPALSDDKKLDLTHTEHDMRDYLAEHPAEVDDGFRLKSVEYKTPLGLFDLYGKIGDRYCVVELKSVKAGLPAVLQLKRYRDFMREHLRQDVVAILMAPSISKNPEQLMKKEGMLYKKFNIHKLEIKKKNNTLDKWIK